MTIIQSIVLGIVQGATEFIPISSSGHLVLTTYFFQWDIPAQDAFIFDILLQVATLFAVLAYFWSDFFEITRAMLSRLRKKQSLGDVHSYLGWYLLIATIPAGFAGLFLNDIVERAFNSPLATAIFLIITAILLLIAEYTGTKSRTINQITWIDALWVGIFQIFALLPGISRSGTTITGGMTRDLDRTNAARFSFLMSVPIMLAAGLYASIELTRIPNIAHQLPRFFVGFAVAAGVGYLSIGWLLKFLNRHPLYYFSIYCAIIGLFTIIWIIK